MHQKAENEAAPPMQQLPFYLALDRNIRVLWGQRPRPQNVVSMKLHEFYPTHHDSASPVSSYIDMVMEDATSNINSPTTSLRNTTTSPIPTAATSEAVEGSLESVDSFEDLKVYVWELTSTSVIIALKNWKKKSI